MNLRSLKTRIKHSIFAISALFLLTIVTSSNISAWQITGLDDVSIFIDPGHSETENQGLYGYSEPQKVLRIGLALRDMLLSQTDISAVYMSRTTDYQQVPLSQRDDLANATDADFYYSIHSNAGGSKTNNTLMLHGGWRKNGATVEKTPNGGKAFGDILIDELTAAMRIPTIGNYADRTFYQGFPNTHDNQWPYLFVNRTTNMASVLSEGGFHTNPYQQQRNLNAEYKRLEAQAAFWTVIEYFGATERPVVGIATGEIKNSDTGKPLNGATVSIDGKTYTTDTYESLFKNYSNDPDELGNGFYYIENITNGNQQIIVSADGFYSDTANIDVVNDDFTFHDVSLSSSIPPSISGYDTSSPFLVNPGKDLVLNFTRGMNRASVENALSFTPADSIQLNWISDSELRIKTNFLAFRSNYTLKIDSTAYDASSYQHNLDGNADSVAGDSFVLNIKTGAEDIQAPIVSNIYPTNTRFNELKPIASATFSELLDTATVNGAIEIKKGSYVVPGITKYYEAYGKTAINFFPTERLDPNGNYVLKIAGTVSDTVGNALGSDIVRTFPTTNQEISSAITISSFESGISEWWQPDQSGSTTGIEPSETSLELETDLVNVFTASTNALRINYGWRTSESEFLIRLYRNKTTPKFGNQRIIQSYVFGDGQGNQIRYVIRDGANQLEASPWYTVDWLGWKLVSWDLANDDIIPWANGNGTVSGNAYFDSFQVTRVDGKATSGFVIFDDLQAVEMGMATSNEDELVSDIPSEIELNQNYPNPFNPSTSINFGLPQRSSVELNVYDLLGRKVATLFTGTKAAGSHTIQFDASNLSSGIYLYQLKTDFGIVSKRMTLLK